MPDGRRHGAHGGWLPVDEAGDDSSPAVIGAEPEFQSAQTPVELVYVLSEQLKPGDEDIIIEMRELPDGQAAMMAYSSVEELEANCGKDQPWVGLPIDRLDGLAEQAEADVVLWDVPLLDDDEPETSGEDGQ